MEKTFKESVYSKSEKYLRARASVWMCGFRCLGLWSAEHHGCEEGMRWRKAAHFRGAGKQKGRLGTRYTFNDLLPLTNFPNFSVSQHCLEIMNPPKA